MKTIRYMADREMLPPVFLQTTQPSGAYFGMCKDYEERHRAYCEKWGYEYLHETVPQITNGYPKIRTAKRLIAAGHSHVFLVDCDCLIVDFERDLREATPGSQVIAAAVYPVPWDRWLVHYNTGMAYVQNTPDTLEFLDDVLMAEGRPSDGLGDCEQSRINELLFENPKWSDAGYALPHWWNSIQHFKPSDRDIVAAWHGAYDPITRRQWMQAYAKAHPYPGVDIQSVPTTVDTPPNLTNQSSVDAALRAGEYDKALAFLRAITESNPYEVNAYKDMHALLSRQSDNEGIIQEFRKACAVAPEDVTIHFALAVAYDAIGDFERSDLHYNTAVAIDPHCGFIHAYRAYALLKRGFNCANAESNWRQGLSDYEFSPYMPAHPARRVIRTPIPMWDGKPIPGKRLYVSYEQGMGDGIWIAQWFKLLKERSKATIIVECPPSLMRLYERVKGIDLLVAMRPLEISGYVTTWDEHIPMMSILRVLEIDPSNHSMQPYISVDAPEKIEGDGIKVGFCWQGSRTHSGDSIRSIPWSQFEPLTKMNGIIPVSVQFGENELPNSPSGDFLVTARRIAGCDLIVTVDSAVAHIAGALGIPCYMLIADQCDWRWFSATDKTPWYRSMCLFRQEARDDWNPVIQRVKEQIERDVFIMGMPRNASDGETFRAPIWQVSSSTDQMSASQHPL